MEAIERTVIINVSTQHYYATRLENLSPSPIIRQPSFPKKTVCKIYGLALVFCAAIFITRKIYGIHINIFWIKDFAFL